MQNQHPVSAKKTIAPAIYMLFLRILLFLIFQIIIAVIINSWGKSEKYWLLTATLTNFTCIVILYFLFKKDGVNYWHIFRFKRSGLKKDLLIFFSLLLIIGPVVFAPGYLLSRLIWDDPDTPTKIIFGPIEPWLVYPLLIIFPVSIAFAELATYFGYIMPKLKTGITKKWLVILLPVLFLSLQHCTLPFVPDPGFILYRGLAFFPFALLIGISLYYRPSLFPYFVILHAVMDFGTGMMFLMEIQ